jgi:DMSO/TMAO reductase YedYZ heme-binding membrane subunit
MIKLLFDFIQFLYTLAPLLTSLAVLTLAALLLSKSIKRHATVYYTVFAIPFVMVALPFAARLAGVEMFSFSRIPFLGSILRDYIHAGTLGFPLLIIIMYMGALSPKNPQVKKLLGIRKELSILSGFPILTHSLVRVTNNFPRALDFFIGNEAGGEAAGTLGAGISNSSLVLGIVMLALFIPLWVTSFDSVHKRMGNARWKKLQKWSYVLYATLFIHAIGIQAGTMLNLRGGRGMPRPTVEAPATPAGPQASHQHGERAAQAEPQASHQHSERAAQAEPQASHQHSEHDAQAESRASHQHGERAAQAEPQSPANSNANRTEAAAPAARGGHQPSMGFSDIKVGQQARQYIHIASLLLIFGSYLYLRLKKAGLKKQKNQ